MSTLDQILSLTKADAQILMLENINEDNVSCYLLKGYLILHLLSEKELTDEMADFIRRGDILKLITQNVNIDRELNLYTQIDENYELNEDIEDFISNYPDYAYLIYDEFSEIPVSFYRIDDDKYSEMFSNLFNLKPRTGFNDKGKYSSEIIAWVKKHQPGHKNHTRREDAHNRKQNIELLERDEVVILSAWDYGNLPRRFHKEYVWNKVNVNGLNFRKNETKQQTKDRIFENTYGLSSKLIGNNLVKLSVNEYDSINPFLKKDFSWTPFGEGDNESSYRITGYKGKRIR